MFQREINHFLAVLVHLLFVALAAAWASDAAAGPCEGPVLLQSNFDVVPLMWQTSANNPSVSDGQLVMQPSQNGISRVSLDLGGGHDIEACIFSAFAGGHGGQAGLSVFAAGTEILFAIDDSGRAVIRKNGSDTNGWVDLVPPRADPAIAPKFEFNQLAVKINGSNATFSVNDVELAAVKGAIPDGPLTLSIDATSDAEAVSTWRFDELTVTVDPIIAAIAQSAGGPPGLLDTLVEEAPGCSGATILSDDFTVQVSGPLAADPALAVVDGKLDMKLSANGNHRVPWPVAGSREVDACATVALVDGAGSDASLNIGGADGAVLFDVDPQHGVAGIYLRDAMNAVSSLVKKRWMPALRRDPGAENKLHIRITGDRAIFYVNGAKFDSVEGRLPKGPLHVELEGLGGRSEATWAFDDLKVTSSKPLEVAAAPPISVQTPAKTTSAPALTSVPANPAPAAAQSLPAGSSGVPVPAPASAPATTQTADSPSGGATADAATPRNAAESGVATTIAPQAQSARKVVEVGPPSCVTDWERIEGPVLETMDGWEYCAAEATPAQQQVDSVQGNDCHQNCVELHLRVRLRQNLFRCRSFSQALHDGQGADGPPARQEAGFRQAGIPSLPRCRIPLPVARDKDGH